MLHEWVVADDADVDWAGGSVFDAVCAVRFDLARGGSAIRSDDDDGAGHDRLALKRDPALNGGLTRPRKNDCENDHDQTEGRDAAGGLIDLLLGPFLEHETHSAMWASRR